MSNEEAQNKPKTNADRGSIATGFEVGGSIENSKIEVHNVINNYAAPEPLKSPNAEKIIKDLERFEPETILIPEGPFWMGNDPGDGIPDSEKPRHEVNLPIYRIGKYPVKNVEYQKFVSQNGIEVNPAMGWNGQVFPEGLGNYPVTGVTFREALAYCEWLSRKTGGKRIYTLPSEAQWEKACRGGNNHIYPWGDQFDEARCNHGKPSIAPVDKYKEQNDFGCCDLVGNVQQWTCSLWGKKLSPPQYVYPWNDDARNDLEASDEIRRVLRGSRRDQGVASHRCGVRNGAAPGERGPNGARFGFRVVMIV